MPIDRRTLPNTLSDALAQLAALCGGIHLPFKFLEPLQELKLASPELEPRQPWQPTSKGQTSCAGPLASHA